jgi:hypothetical protein
MTQKTNGIVDERGRNPRTQYFRMLGLLLVPFGAFFLAVWLFLPALVDFRCAHLLVDSIGLDEVPLPEHCAQTDHVPNDDMVTYLEAEREKRGLIFKKWIVCTSPHDASKPIFPFAPDSRWLPSYVPGTYEFRRTVVIVPYARPVPVGSRVVAELCLEPWAKYVRQIAGECHGKYAAWK